METPPKLPQPKSLRTAMTLNLIFPGSGLIYLGRWMIGSLLVVLFTACFIATLVIFVRGYSEYLAVVTSGDILEEGRIEHLATQFHVGWLIGCSFGAVFVYGLSMLALITSKSREGLAR